MLNLNKNLTLENRINDNSNMDKKKSEIVTKINNKMETYRSKYGPQAEISDFSIYRECDNRGPNDPYEKLEDLYNFLILDKSVVNYINKYGSKRLVNSVMNYYLTYDKFVRQLSNKVLKNPDNKYWFFFGRKDSQNKNKFHRDHLKVGENLEYHDLNIGFKYYIKPSHDDMSLKPEKVIDFYKELIEKSYNANEVYQFKIPKSFSNFLLRKDGFIFYLNKNKVDDFMKRISNLEKKYRLNLNEELGFDIRANEGNFSYTKFKANAIFNSRNKNPPINFDSYDFYNVLRNK